MTILNSLCRLLPLASFILLAAMKAQAQEPLRIVDPAVAVERLLATRKRRDDRPPAFRFQHGQDA